MYKQKYIKYKSKYLSLKNIQKAGTFYLDEGAYSKIRSPDLRNIPVDLTNTKYIAGPMSLTIMFNKDLNKKIYLFGDVHVYTSFFDCGVDDEKNTIYLSDYLNKYLSEEKNKTIDLFIELPYQLNKNKIIPSMKYGILENIKHIVDPCFKLLSDKSECKKIYPNVRFHAMDIRYYY